MGFDETHGSPPPDLVAELQHRMRTMLATMRLIARRSAETSETLEDYVAHLDGRLAALARVQSAAIRDPLGGLDLGLLVVDEVTSAGLSHNTQLRFAGPPVLLHPRAAECLTLALHELMTNAIKFGALSTNRGRLDIRWYLDRSDHPASLSFEWTESGAPMRGDVVRQGFGTTVLTELLEQFLGATTRIERWSDGLRYTLTLPLTAGILEPVAPGDVFAPM